MLAWLLTDEPLAPLMPWGPWKRCQTLIKRLQWQVWGAGGGRMTSCSWNKTAQILTGRPGGPAGPRGPVPPGSPCVTRHENHFHKKESNKIKVSLPALHRVTEVKLTVSPLGPEDPWGPGRPRSPFSPCSPGGPMRPIRPWWPFSPLAPGSPRRPGKPGGPCRRRSRERRKEEDESRRTDEKRKDGGLKKAAGAKCSVTEHQVQTLCLLLPKVQAVLSLQQLLVILVHPETQLLTHLVSEQQHIKQQVSHTVNLFSCCLNKPKNDWYTELTTDPGSPRRPSVPGFPGWPWGPTGPVFPGGPTAPGSPCEGWRQRNAIKRFLLCISKSYASQK